ncbi:hypothetical protein BC827DRAFT_83120 [Russula dissimulans]|nr:hypothetical protein BC827DRAFT_83120 [Russula dissimulans]
MRRGGLGLFIPLSRLPLGFPIIYVITEQIQKVDSESAPYTWWSGVVSVVVAIPENTAFAFPVPGTAGEYNRANLSINRHSEEFHLTIEWESWNNESILPSAKRYADRGIVKTVEPGQQFHGAREKRRGRGVIHNAYWGRFCQNWTCS